MKDSYHQLGVCWALFEIIENHHHHQRCLHSTSWALACSISPIHSFPFLAFILQIFVPSVLRYSCTWSICHIFGRSSYPHVPSECNHIHHISCCIASSKCHFRRHHRIYDRNLSLKYCWFQFVLFCQNHRWKLANVVDFRCLKSPV